VSVVAVEAPSAAPGDLGAHLSMIQGVIGRMGQNAFNAKTWAITVMAAVFALGPTLGTTTTSTGAVVVALLLFWTMDAYFLRQEHLFRRLYMAAVRGEVPAFSMDTSPHEDDVGGLVRFFVSPSVWPVHVITVLAVGARAFKG
jgi:hypothetical protein